MRPTNQVFCKDCVSWAGRCLKEGEINKIAADIVCRVLKRGLNMLTAFTCATCRRQQMRSRRKQCPDDETSTEQRQEDPRTLPRGNDPMTERPTAPVIKCLPATRLLGGLMFWCPYCQQWHIHGKGEGYRAPHCINPNGPLTTSDYYIEMATKAELKKIARAINDLLLGAQHNDSAKPDKLRFTAFYSRAELDKRRMAQRNGNPSSRRTEKPILLHKKTFLISYDLCNERDDNGHPMGFKPCLPTG